MSEYDVVEEARKVWNCENFKHKTHKCRLHLGLCTGVYDCKFFKPLNDAREPPKAWIEFCISVHKNNCGEMEK